MSNSNDNGAGAPASEEGKQDAQDQGNQGQDDQQNGEGSKGDDGQGDAQQRQPEDPAAKKTRLERELKQLEKKNPDLFKKSDDASKGKAADEKEPTLDYGQKAYLIANKIEADDEHDLALRIMKETGKELEDVIKGGYFKAELKALREDNAAKDAIPDTRRSRASSPSSVEYWLEKGGLPPNNPENRELRQKIVNARMQKDKSASQFTDTPVVGG